MDEQPTDVGGRRRHYGDAHAVNDAERQVLVKSTTSTSNDADSDLEQNVSRLCQYLSESDDDEETDEASSSSQVAVALHTMKEPRSQQPRPSTGPYHQRRPVLPADFLNIPPPSHPPDASPSLEHRPLPPQWQPPVPPTPQSSSASCMDESQYDEAQPPEPAARPSKQALPGSFHKTPTLPRTANGYEVSASQMQRDSGGVDWDDSCRGSLLRENPETGSFYVPSGSGHSGHTTMSSLSPQSRRLDNDKCSYSLLPGARTTVPVNVLPVRPEYTGGPAVNNSNATKSAMSPLAIKKPSKQKKLQSTWTRCSWRCLAYALAVALLFCLAVICYLLVPLLSAGSLGAGGSSYSDGMSVFGDSRPTAASVLPLRPLPESFELGEEVVADLPAGVLVYTYFAVQQDTRVSFNLSVEPQAKLVVYGRQTVVPSPTAHDFVEIVRGDRLHMSGVVGDRRKRRINYASATNNMRSTIFLHYLLAGRWHLGFLNDGVVPQTIRFTAALSDDRVDDCKFDCYGKGICKDGKCFCHRGFSGPHCEETSCPVLCSGNGLFAGGRCHCHQGWKGTDCDMPAHVCEMPNCSGHGNCGNDGRCVCDRGFAGDFCDRPACPSDDCSGHGVCVDGKCYCEFGWKNENCDDAYTSQSMCALGGLVGSHSDVVCSNHGVFDQDTSSCLCDRDFTGIRCQTEICPVACIHGVCKESVCDCDHGWKGDQCDTLACLPGCEDHGSCQNGTCKCVDGWNGANCQLAGCPNNCNSAGDCRKFANMWICACDAQHYGFDCSIPRERECDDERDNDGDGLTDCEDSECCSTKACMKSQLCQTVVHPATVLMRGNTPSVTANFFQKIKFLIQADSVQQYADERLFNESRASVIRGRVLSENGAPLIGVRVAETAHPPLYGFTITRGGDGGGVFDLLVNGGRSVTLQFMRKPYDKIERQFTVPWNDIVYVGDIVLSRDQAEIAPKPKSVACQALRRHHRLRPTLLTSWLVTRFAGAVGSNGGQLLADSRVIYDSIAIPGTSDLFLTYDSARAAGFKSTVTLQLVPETMPQQLRIVSLIIDIAGVHFETTLEAKPNLTYTYGWDKRNVYAQAVYGLTDAKVSVGYVYAGCDAPIWEYDRVKLDGHKSSGSKLGGWNLNIHHHFDIVNNVLERGDGSVVYLSETGSTLATTLGSNTQRPLNCPFCNGPASSASLFQPMALAVDGNGSLFVGDYNLIRRLSPHGAVTTVLELSPADTAHAYFLAVDPTSGDLHISLPLRRQVWKIGATDDAPVDATANYQVVVGDGNTCAGSTCGDGGPADIASLSFPKGIAFDARGALFIADGRRVRVVTADKLIRTLVAEKTWTPRPCFADIDVSELNLEWPTALAVDPLSQMLLVLDADVIYRIDVAAELARVEVGAPAGCDSLTTSANDTLAVVRLHSAKALVADDQGTLLVVESNGKRLNQVRAFGRDGRPTLIAGKTSKCDCDRRNCPCDNDGHVLARDAHLHQPVALAVDSAGTLHIADQANFKIKSMRPLRPDWDAQQRLYNIVSADTNEIYLFNGFGQHVATQSLLSAQFVYNFTYHIDNSYGRLLQVIGGGGHRLYFVRRSDTEIQIETSHAVKTTLRLGNFDQMLETVALPDGGFVRLDHDAVKGLLLSKVDADGRAWFYDYDADGRADRLVTPTGDTFRVVESVVGHQLVSRVEKNGRLLSQFAISPSEMSAIGASNRRVLLVDGGFYVDANGYRSQFDGSDHPLLAPHESTLLKRKATLPSLTEPQRRELTSRLEWRNFVRREGKGAAKRVAQVGRRPRVNGRNVLTVEFDRKEHTDNVTDHADHKLLVVHFNEAGQIIGYEPSVADLAPMNISYDAHGRMKRLAWGERRAAFVYDQQSRLTDATAGPDGNLLPRKYAYEQESSVLPSTVQVPSGLDYTVVYDGRGGLSEISTPSGDNHRFSVVHDFGRSVLVRSVPFASEPFVFALDDQQRPNEFVSPAGLRRVSYQRDGLDRLSAVVADGAVVVYRYVDGSDQPVVVESPHFRRETVRQGPLAVSVSERRAIGDGESLATAAHFAYEYDDLLRLSAVHASFDGSATLEPLRFTYDANTGRLSRVKSYNLLYDGTKTRLMGDNNVVLERMYGAHRELVHLRLVIHGNKVMEQTMHYDSAGRLEGVERTVAGEQRAPQVRTYNVDGTLGQLNVGEQPHRWTLHYDLDGRLKALNDDKLQLVDGVPVDMDQLKFETDASGAVIRRGDEWFEYDAFGRLRRVSQKSATNVSYVYDDRDRLIGRKRGNEALSRFFYALPDRPALLTHATVDDAITAFYYDDEDRLFAMQRAGTHYLIIADVDGTPSFVFDGNGAVVKEVLRDPLGRIVTDTNPDFDLPIGWRGHLQDAHTGIVLIAGRPMDTSTMRFMSVSPNAILAPIDPFYPEAVDLFRVDAASQQNLPTDVVSWLRLVGIDMHNVAPLLQLNDQRWLSAHWDAAASLCPRHRPVLSAAECGVATRIQHFSRFATVGPSLVLPPAPNRGEIHARWSAVPSVVGSGVAISTDRANRAIVHLAESVEMATHDALNLLLNESFFVGAQLGPDGAGSRAIVERHFWKKSADKSVQDLTSLGIVSETATLTPLLNISVGEDQLIIIGAQSRTYIHYGDDMEALKNRLAQEQTMDSVRRLWAHEVELVRHKRPTRTQWSDAQRQQLMVDGAVSGFAPVFRPPVDSGVAASSADLTFWTIESANR